MKKRIVVYFYIVIVVIMLLQLNAIANEPPEKPTITGPETARIGKTCVFTIVSNDPECDNIGYNICGWGDDTFCNYSLGLFPSGEEINIDHVWSETGEYTIKLCAVDCHGACSEYVTFEIKIIKNRFLTTLELIIEQFPFLEQIYNFIYSL